MKKFTAVLLVLVMILLSATSFAASAAVIKLGDKGANVKTVQTLLKKYNYYSGKIDGIFDKDVLDAVKSFQKYNNLNVDGKVGEKTMYYLKNSDSAVHAPIKDKTGNKTEVKHIQERLQYYGYYSGSIDGLYGSGTVAAVRAFQSANSLIVDGAVGSKTLTKLNSDNAISKNQSATAFKKLKLNDVSETVKYVQKQLWSLGYYSGDWSGVFGSQTWNAVKAFQQDNGLTADGVVGKVTWNTLFASDVKSKDQQKKDVSEEIKSFQQKLKDLKWYSGKLTGKYDAATVAAVKAFQAANNLTVDGAVGPKTLAKLNAPDAPVKPEYVPKKEASDKPKIYPGVQGKYVRDIQEILFAKGYYTSEIDGKYGRKTKEAVLNFQYDRGLETDGIVGTLTWDALLH